MEHFGLLGERLGHSLSVPIHEAVFKKLGMEADYRLIEIPREAFASRASELMKELHGFNVTIPYKREIMPLLKRTVGAAEAIGAVNTVVCRDAAGYNTDAPGFAHMLAAHGIDPLTQPCYVLGSGGASLAAAEALRRAGASRVVTVSRHPAEHEISYDTLREEFSGVLVNCTPVGMWPDVSGCPLSEELLSALLPRAVGVADVIYNPSETVLTRTAKARGIPACTGLTMLIAQAVEAERLWHPQADIPADLTQTLEKELTLF